MKRMKLLLAVFVLFATVQLDAAIKPYYQENKITTIRDGVASCDFDNRRYDFRVEIISDTDGLKWEIEKKGFPFVAAKPEERYSIRLHNPLPVRVAVNLTVDGLNTISGKPSSISDGRKWIIDPYSYITIRGWQVNEGEARRFYFTEKSRTYAAWRGEQLNKDLAVNCGVIGAAYFWSKKELQDYFDQNPTYTYSSSYKCGVGAGLPAPAPMSENILGRSESRETKDEALSQLKKEKAGTGMGERESHPTQYVNFDYDTGMYKAHQALIVFYDFVAQDRPNPFPGLSYAPEMK